MVSRCTILIFSTTKTSAFIVTLNSEQLYRRTAEVPQGSALRPILFAMYIQNNSCTKGLLVKFADDFTIEVENQKSLDDAAKKAIQQIEEKCLVLNTGKAKLLNFSRRKKSKSHGLIINDVNIQENDEVKLLGCQISKTLNWN